MINEASFEWFGHHKLLRHFVLDAKVVNEEPLRIGAGREATVFEPVDLVVLKTFDAVRRSYVPVIPGSSWKGVFRSHAVRICRGRGLSVCDGVPRSTCLGGNEFMNYEQVGADALAKVSAIVKAEVKACLLDLIFGAPGLLSHVTFLDSIPEGNFRLGYRSMVAIDRRTGTASRGALFTVEYVEPGAVFDFRLVARNLPNYALGLLAEVLRDIDEGIVRVGGLKSRGFGRVRFRELAITVREFGGKPLRALDPIDAEVGIEGERVEDGDAWILLDELIKVWRNSLSKLREVSDNGWRWGVVVAEKS